jgi:hypothetical protein
VLVLLEKCFGHTLSQISSLSALSSFAWVRTSRETYARPLYSSRSLCSASPNGREASTRSLHRSRSFHTPSSPFEKLPNDLYTVHKAYTRPLHRSRSFRTLFTPFEKLPHALSLSVVCSAAHILKPPPPIVPSLTPPSILDASTVLGG